jgi:hypothetical protein
MTLHDAKGCANLHFVSFSGFCSMAKERLLSVAFCLLKTGAWLGAESNRRHVDFQSTALPTELPSLLPMKNELLYAA